MNNEKIEKIVFNLLLEYLSDKEVDKILKNKNKSIAWFRLFQGYSEKEVDEILIAIYSFYPSYLPSIQEIKEKCVAPIDVTKYQQEWDFILTTIKRSLDHDEIHNLIYSALSEEAKLSLNELGGIVGLKNNVDPKYMGAKRKNFIGDCQRYKEHLKAGLIKPLVIKIREIKRDQETEYDPESFKKLSQMIANHLSTNSVNNLVFKEEDF